MNTEQLMNTVWILMLVGGPVMMAVGATVLLVSSLSIVFLLIRRVFSKDYRSRSIKPFVIAFIAFISGCFSLMVGLGTCNKFFLEPLSHL